MSNDETARELEKLRADVAALSAARQEETVKPTEQPAPVAPAAAADENTPAAIEEQKSQLEELGDLLQAEIRDLPTITCLTVFSLGIVMGRLMR